VGSRRIEEWKMNRLLVVLVVVVAFAIGLGFYLKWFRIGSDSGGGKDSVTLTVDEDKFKEDKKRAAEKVHDLAHQEKAKTPGEK
jgi:hypothetical protein